MSADGARRVQAKLEVSRPGDAHEREADQVAEQVMHSALPTVQRQCSACETEEKPVPRDVNVPDQQTADGGSGIPVDIDMPLPDELQTSDRPTPAMSQPPSAALIPGGGRELDPVARDFFEPRFGFSFNGVRIHTGSDAAATARSLDARAYTVGRDVVFGDSQYAPHTTEGLRLIAHELTHVVQQNRSNSHSGPVVQRWMLGGVAPTNTNTIVCDGSGGIRVQAGATGTATQTPCLIDCIRRHELSHRGEALAANANICAGAADQTQVTFTDEPERRGSEYRAYDVEVGCLNGQKDAASATCRPIMDARITQCEGLRDGFR